METLLWESNVRLLPAAAISLAAAWMITAGIVRQVRQLALPYEVRGKNHGWLRAMRQMIQGLSLLAIGLGWAFQWPVAIAAGAIFGFEETIETSIATWALKQEAEGREGFA
jgi:hypothetical protein